MKSRRVVKRKNKPEADRDLAIKYRPKNFDQVVGQDAVIKLLATSLSMNRFPHAVLFHGPRGCGKTTVARIVAKMLGASGRDLYEFNIAHTGGKDRAREIADGADYHPLESKVKVYTFDECHRATKDFQDALLKAVEEPPPFVYYIFVTTEPDKLLETIKSRCTPFRFSKLKSADIKEVIDRILKEEGLEVKPGVLRTVINDSDGDCRAAIGRLNMIMGFETEDIDSLLTDENKEAIVELCRALLDRKGWKIISGLVKALKDTDLELIRRTVLKYMNTVLLGKDNPLSYMIVEGFSEPFHDMGRTGLTAACYLVTKQGEVKKDDTGVR